MVNFRGLADPPVTVEAVALLKLEQRDADAVKVDAVRGKEERIEELMVDKLRVALSNALGPFRLDQRTQQRGEPNQPFPYSRPQVEAIVEPGALDCGALHLLSPSELVDETVLDGVSTVPNFWSVAKGMPITTAVKSATTLPHPFGLARSASVRVAPSPSPY